MRHNPLYRLTHTVCTFGMLAILAACEGNVTESLGLERSAPDEFSVISRPPLTVPPEFNLIPPAENTDDLAFGVPTDVQAEALVKGKSQAPAANARFGAPDTALSPIESGSLRTDGESVLLKRAGAQSANPEIRQLIQQEQPQTRRQAKEEGITDYLWWKPSNDKVVDASAEARRVKEAREEGQPVTEGETPMKKEKDTGILGRIFNY